MRWPILASLALSLAASNALAEDARLHSLRDLAGIERISGGVFNA